MNAFNLIKLVAIGLAVVVVLWFFRNYKKEKLSLRAQLKIIFIGLISNLLDTIGIGSFAVIIALRWMLGVMPDDVKLIGSMNI